MDDRERKIDKQIELLRTSSDLSILRQAVDSLEKIDLGNPKASQVIKKLIETLRANKDRLMRKDIKIFEAIGKGNPTIIKALRKIWHTTNSALTRQLLKETLKKIDPLANKKVPKVEEDLDLFLQVTRVKDTVDGYFAVNHHITEDLAPNL